MNITDHKKDFDKVVDFFKNDIASLRTGRASTVMVEDIQVESYGTRQPLKALASISIADSKTLNIEPWDKSLLVDIERGIREASMGFNPVNDGIIIRLHLPELTVERRQELTKVLHQKMENARISMRQVREDVRNLINEGEKDKTITEDGRYGLQEDLDKMIKEYNEIIKEIGAKKEKEVNTI